MRSSSCTTYNLELDSLSLKFDGSDLKVDADGCGTGWLAVQSRDQLSSSWSLRDCMLFDSTAISSERLLTRDVRLSVGVVGESKKETGLSYTRVSDEEKLEEVVVVSGETSHDDLIDASEMCESKAESDSAGDSRLGEREKVVVGGET